MTELDLPAIRGRLEGVTPGPWYTDPDDKRTMVIHENGEMALYVGHLLSPDDAEFIAEARELVPALLDALEEARADSLDRTEAAFREWVRDANTGMAMLSSGRFRLGDPDRLWNAFLAALDPRHGERPADEVAGAREPVAEERTP